MSKKAEIKSFWAQEAKMSITANSLLESVEKKIFHEIWTYIISRK